MEEINNSDSKKPLKSFWRADGRDWIADLNEMKKAIVVAYYTPSFPSSIDSYYAISPRSFFPFTKEQGNVRYPDYQSCCLEAEKIILDWMQSLINPESKLSLLVSDAIDIKADSPLFYIQK